MIKVNVKYNNNKVYELVIKGHAGYDVHGKDIVCAAVSAMAITTVNNIIALDDSIDYEENSGLLIIRVKRDTEVASERITTSRRISKREYNELYDSNLDTPIRKCRYCFTYDNQYYKLDVFENPAGLVILETELTNKSKEVVIPDFLSIKKDITEDKEYRNVNLYKKINL